MTLYRQGNQSILYYRMKIHPTLFGEFQLERAYGKLYQPKPNRILCDYYESGHDVKMRFLKILKDKVAQGYRKQSQPGVAVLPR